LDLPGSFIIRPGGVYETRGYSKYNAAFLFWLTRRVVDI